MALGLFAWGKIRHDVVALMALFMLVLAGVVPHDLAFAGFVHPAVVTVAAVLVISRGLRNSGLIDVIGSWTMRAGTPL